MRNYSLDTLHKTYRLTSHKAGCASLLVCGVQSIQTSSVVVEGMRR